MSSFTWIIGIIGVATAAILYLVGDEFVQPISTLYNGSSPVYTTPNTYHNIILQYWGFFPIVLLLGIFIYYQAQMQKRF